MKLVRKTFKISGFSLRISSWCLIGASEGEHEEIWLQIHPFSHGVRIDTATCRLHCVALFPHPKHKTSCGTRGNPADMPFLCTQRWGVLQVGGSADPVQLRHAHDYANSAFGEIAILLRRQVCFMCLAGPAIICSSSSYSIFPVMRV